MEHADKVALIKELRVGLHAKMQEVDAILSLLDRGVGAREIALTKTKLQEAKNWAGEALGELGEFGHYILPK